MQEIVFPSAIVGEQFVTNGQALLKKQPLQIGLSETHTAEINGGYIILDYGKEMCGGVRILTFLSDTNDLNKSCSCVIIRNKVFSFSIFL